MEFTRNRSQEFLPACLAHMSTQHEEELRDVSPEHREAITAAVFDEMHKWAADRLPMGVNAAVSEEFLRKGLHAAKLKVQHNPPAGVGVVEVLTVLSVLFSVVRWIAQWWMGQST